MQWSQGISLGLLITLLFYCYYSHTQAVVVTDAFTQNMGLTSNENKCTNTCGPTSRCATTQQQCFADSDCPGCSTASESINPLPNKVPGADDAGKLTTGLTPQYSPLTSGYGTHERIIDDGVNAVIEPNVGVNILKSSADIEQQLYNNRYVLSDFPNMVQYPVRKSMTGTFEENGPPAANAVTITPVSSA